MILNDNKEDNMSIENYKKAVELMKQNKDKCHFIGIRPDNLIELAETKLNLSFIGLYTDFLKNFGAGNFASQEIYGIIDDDFVNSSVPDAIWYTITEREEINLPNSLIVIYDTGMGELYCIDFNRVSKFGEPTIVSYIPGIDNDMQKYEVVANDFGDLLYELVEGQLKI
jgi:hypothetical protein